MKEKYVLAEDVEVTIEVNPGTVNLAKLSHYFQCGINRLSIGLQSAHNDELASSLFIRKFQKSLLIMII